ncbi:MAG: SPFH domain-containing protein [Gammaproteobacteria bacterium]|nr:SPFH domain-containing protein [Gammaproteobacteria bacterium]
MDSRNIAANEEKNYSNQKPSLQYAIPETPLDTLIEDKVELSLDEIVCKANITLNENEDDSVLPRKIMEAFNKQLGNQEHLIQKAWATQGTASRIKPTEFWMAATNQKPELNMDTGHRMIKRITDPNTKAESFGRVKFFEPYYGAYGVYVVNVPPGKFAKAKSNIRPIILGEGTHVIEDKAFQFDPQSGFVDQSDLYINHEVLHIIRVPQGQYAKITIDNVPKLLGPSPEPYVFKSAVFTYDGLVNQGDYYIKHGVTQKRGKNEIVEDIIHIIRVPAGFLVKAWNNTEPVFLEARDKAYVFNSPRFRVETNDVKAKPEKDARGEVKDEDDIISKNPIFFKATENEIVHGKLKRLIPPLKTVFVINKDGVLDIVDRRTVLDSPTDKVVTTLPTSIQTLTLPTEERSKLNKKSGDNAADGIVFVTKDSLRMAVRIMVAFQLTDPRATLQQLLPDDIKTHLENLAITEMGKLIQAKTSQELMASYNSNLAKNNRAATPVEEEKDDSLQPKKILDPDFGRVTLADTVRERLAGDLEHFGITLHRLSIESFRPLNEKILEQMANQALQTAEANTKMATLKQKTEIETQEAQRAASVLAIKIEQDNKNKITQSQAELTAAENLAKAKVVAAKADADSKKIAAEAEAKSIEMVGEANAKAIEASARVYDEHPAMAQLKQVEFMSAGLKNAKLDVMSSDIATSAFGMFRGIGNMLKAQDASQPQAVVPLLVEEKQQEVLAARKR